MVLLVVVHDTFLVVTEPSLETLPPTTTSSSSKSSHVPREEELRYPLAIPQGEAVALPSVRVSEQHVSDRSIYGGTGDKKHLGGFTDIDISGISPAAWKWIVQRMNVKSILDVGCGRGISTSWFLMHGVDALCVEGSHDAKERTMLPDPEHQMVEHDFSRGPWWPSQTYDAVWCVEFLEHVGRDYHHNYLPALRKAGILFTSHSIWGGLASRGSTQGTLVETQIPTVRLPILTRTHTSCPHGGMERNQEPQQGSGTQRSQTGRYARLFTQNVGVCVACESSVFCAKFVPSHAPSLQVFINTAVTALPQHAHLYYEPGCYVNRTNGVLYQRDCGVNEESPLPDSFKPLPLTAAQDKKWFDWVKSHVQPVEPKA